MRPDPRPPASAPQRGAARRWLRAFVGSWQHLSVRITGVVALGVLVVMVFAHVAHVRLVNDEMRPQIGKQLFANATRAADDVDERIERRMRALEAVATEVLAQPYDFTPDTAQEFLRTHSGLSSLFEHLMVVGPDGRVLADRPKVANVRGADLSDRPYFRRARDTSRIAISEPFKTPLGDFQIVALAMPMIGADGNFGGALVGSLSLVKSGLFAEMREARIGDTGYFAAFTTSGTTLLHPDPRRILQPIAEGDEKSPAQRAIAGWNGWDEGIVDGVDALSAYKRLRHVPWIMVAVQPSAEAFAPLARLDRVLLGARATGVLLLGLLVMAVTSWALTPFARLRDQIDELEDGRRNGFVDESGPHEITVVARAFNRLKAKQQALSDSLTQREAFHRTLNDRSPVGVFMMDEKARLTYCNTRFELMVGRDFERACGWGWVDAIHEEDRPAARERWLAARWARQGFVQEFRFVQPRGEVVWVRVHHEPMGNAAKAPEYLAVALDVTAEREAAARLQSERHQGQQILEAIRDALVVISATGRVVDVTRAAEALTGWPRDKAIGTPIGRVVRVYGADDAPIDLAEIIDQRRFRTEDWNCETANGERIAVELVWHCFDDSLASGGVLALRDITERRKEAERVAWAAAHDPLTGLKNRRSFEEALAGAHAQYLRTGTGSAVLMIDLDHFKQVNDRGGHEAGDEMLRRVTRVLGDAVRTSDIAARLGGDEFALLMPGCTEARAQSIAESIRDEVARLVVVRDGIEMGIGASIGITAFAPGDPDWTHAMQRADTACYHAKRAGRNTIRTAAAPPPAALAEAVVTPQV